MSRKISEVMPPLADNIIKAADLVGTVFVITDIRLVNTKFGARYVYTIDVGDEIAALFLSKTNWRDALYDAFIASEKEPVGPITLVKEEAYYEFRDVGVAGEEEIPF